MSARRLGGTFIVASALAVAFFALLAPGPASASYTKCHGSLAPDNGLTTDDPLAVDYTFYCNHKIHGYTISSCSPVDGFAVAPLVYQGTDPATSDVDGNGGFSCEGNIPGKGIGCNGIFIPGGSIQGGTTKAGEAVVGTITPEAKLCARHHQPRPKLYLSVASVQIDATHHQYIASSLPFRLPNGCQAQARRGHHTNHHRKHHR